MFDTLLSLDKALLIQANTLVSPEMAPILQLCGEIGVIWVAGFLVFLWFRGRALEDNSLKIIALQIFLTITLTYTFYTLIHLLFPMWRANPQEVVNAIGALIPRPFDNSFPSGHGLFMGACVASLMIFYPYRWIIVITTFFCSIMVISRVLVGVHYPLDIIGGIVLGGIGAYIISCMTRQSFARRYLYAPIIALAKFFRL